MVLPGAIAFQTLNFFDQILAGWDPKYETLDIPGDIYIYIRQNNQKFYSQKLIPFIELFTIPGENR